MVRDKINGGQDELPDMADATYFAQTSHHAIIGVAEKMHDSLFPVSSFSVHSQNMLIDQP